MKTALTYLKIAAVLIAILFVGAVIGCYVAKPASYQIAFGAFGAMFLVFGIMNIFFIKECRELIEEEKQYLWKNNSIAWRDL